MAAGSMLLLLVFRLLHLFHVTWVQLHPSTTWFVILTALIIVDVVLLPPVSAVVAMDGLRSRRVLRRRSHLAGIFCQE